MRAYLLCGIGLAAIGTAVSAQTANTHCTQSILGSVNCRTDYQPSTPRTSTADALFEFGAAMRQERQLRALEKQTAILEAMNAESDRKERAAQAEKEARQQQFEAQLRISVDRSVQIALQDGRCDDAWAIARTFERIDLQRISYSQCASGAKKYRSSELAETNMANGLLLHSAGAFYYGNGVPQSHENAAEMLRLAANQGNATAQYSLAMFHRNGTGVVKSDIEAIRLLKMSAAQGLPKAIEALALLQPKEPAKRGKLASRVR